ncbi:stress responsive A B barrel domain-containing protein [Fusarium denticulatum]|uniref:Stress responsive A B barrel domain-containing protein n=1 Tax=Fusarium denticulatum TaxID=48507 RepID=A0A8H6CVJ7_9HYPO|nr:stress responsive A B barrel domain-containing protein [Fusarium denticulatum]
MGINRVVQFQFKTDTSSDAIEKASITHAFVIQFDNPEDRDYYALKDPAHLAVVAELGPLVEKVQIIDLPRND